MKVTVVLDGRPGHEKQSLAIVRALQELVTAEVRQIHLDRPKLLRRLGDLSRLFFSADGGCAYALDDTDLLLGTGSGSHVSVLACKKKYSIPAVTCMAPEPYLRRRFDLCCVPRHDGLREQGNIFLTDGPPVIPAPELARDPLSGLILIGGVDEKSHTWNSVEVFEFVQEIARKQVGIHWQVSSSPRTPADCVELMLDAEKRLTNISFFHFRDTPRGWLEEQYARATYVWVTADSISMIYEALTSGCKVGTMPVAWKKNNNKFQKSIDFLVAKGLVMPFSAAGLKNIASCNPGDFNEARRCACEILDRFFPAEPRIR